MLSGTVFINRGNSKSAIATMHHAGEEVKRKRVSPSRTWIADRLRPSSDSRLTCQISLWIFPEGTRHLSANDDLLPFKKGAFYLAVQCQYRLCQALIEMLPTDESEADGL